LIASAKTFNYVGEIHFVKHNNFDFLKNVFCPLLLKAWSVPYYFHEGIGYA